VAFAIRAVLWYCIEENLREAVQSDVMSRCWSFGSISRAARTAVTLSKGHVNIYRSAKNAATSVNQIERFYARNLPLSAELVRNLQSFGASS
jgi:hypothetical protein